MKFDMDRTRHRSKMTQIIDDSTGPSENLSYALRRQDGGNQRKTFPTEGGNVGESVKDESLCEVSGLNGRLCAVSGLNEC